METLLIQTQVCDANIVLCWKAFYLQLSEDLSLQV